MSSKRLRTVLLASLGVMVLLFTLNYIVGMSLLSKKSQKMVELKLQSKTVENQLNNLSQAKKEIQQYSYFKDVAKTVIPNDKDQAQAVLDIVRMAKESGIQIESIKFPSSNLGETKAQPTPTPGTTTPPTTNTPAASSSASSALSQAKPVLGIKGLYSLELTITPESGTHLPPDKKVTYPKMLDFLRRVERNRRTAQITQVNIQPTTPGVSNSDSINFSLIVNIFMKP